MIIHIVLINNSGEKIRYNYRIVAERFYKNKENFENKYRFEKLILDNYERYTEIYLDKDIEEVLEIAFKIDKVVSSCDDYERKLIYCLEAYNNNIEFVLNNIEDIDVIQGYNIEDLGIDMQYNYIEVKGAYVKNI